MNARGYILLVLICIGPVHLPHVEHEVTDLSVEVGLVNVPVLQVRWFWYGQRNAQSIIPFIRVSSWDILYKKSECQQSATRPKDGRYPQKSESNRAIPVKLNEPLIVDFELGSLCRRYISKVDGCVLMIDALTL